jgi:phage terminase small subunit
MSELTEKLTEKQQICILGLVGGKSKTECAALADCAESTVFRWLADENFRRVLKDAKDTVFESETARLYGLASLAIESFERGLSGKAKAVEVRAAIAVFGQIGRLRENDLLERIERLEQFLESKSK